MLSDTYDIYDTYDTYDTNATYNEYLDCELNNSHDVAQFFLVLKNSLKLSLIQTIKYYKFNYWYRGCAEFSSSVKNNFETSIETMKYYEPNYWYDDIEDKTKIMVLFFFILLIILHLFH